MPAYHTVLIDPSGEKVGGSACPHIHFTARDARVCILNRHRRTYRPNGYSLRIVQTSTEVLPILKGSN